MRVWDIAPGYLSQRSLMEEYRVLGELTLILDELEPSAELHPEAVRWRGHAQAVRLRRDQLVAEMNVRGDDQQGRPLVCDSNATWPSAQVDAPHIQLRLMSQEYGPGERGRIASPKNSQVLWAQHKYSVMARSTERYRSLGREVAAVGKGPPAAWLCQRLVDELRVPATWPRTRNALAHMWGYVSRYVDRGTVADMEESLADAPRRALRKIGELALRHDVTYLLQSTALSELVVYLPEEP